jgi:ribulose 1,5-bisphosphate synthetase/thiazole synthase
MGIELKTLMKTLAGNSMMSEQLQIAIVGGGIGGLTAALALRARGLNVTVFEQAGEQREIGAGISILPTPRFCCSGSASQTGSRR